jgi:hypothetical protein
MSILSQFRSEKDLFFESHPQSPLTPEQKDNFSGLNYFPENPDLRYELEIEEFEEKESSSIQTSTGDVQNYLRYGKIRFKVDGEESVLIIFVNEHGFFLPFVDSLAGKETYGAGRYIEPEPLPNGKFLIDFNLSYNPYCAYNEAWSCPLTPLENRLKVPIQAGEKIFDKQDDNP